MVELPIAGGFYLSDSLPISAQECTNWYVNRPQTDALGSAGLFGTPGIELIASTGLVLQENRGAHTKSGIPYFVNGDALYSLIRTFDIDDNEVFTLNSLGAIEGEGRVSMADNGTQLMILVPGGAGYIFNEDSGTPFQKITDAGFTANGAPQIVKFVDSFFLVTTDEKKFIVSAPNDGLSWNALDFGSAEADPDQIVAPVIFKNQAYILGTKTTEPFQNIAGAGFPFLRISGALIDKGLFAPFGSVNTDNSFMWIGGGVNESAAIWQSTGGAPAKVSTTAIDTAIAEFTQEELQQSFAFAYAQKGGYFVGFSFPTRTFVYDTITQAWHERKSQLTDPTDKEVTVRWRVNSLTSAYGRILVGDSEDGRIGSVDKDVFTEYGRNIIRTVTTSPFHNQGSSFSIPRLELTVESGVSDRNEKDAVFRLSTSRDGKTFTDERIRPIGKTGEYDHRVTWNRNGRYSRFSVLKFVMSDPVKPVIIKLEGDIVAGRV